MARIELLEQLEVLFDGWFGDIWPALEEPVLRQEVARLVGPREVLGYFESELARTPANSEHDREARELTRRWMYGLAESADRKWEDTWQLLRRWEEDQALRKDKLFSGGAQALFAQLHRTLGGLAHTIHGERPFGTPEDALFCIEWVGDYGKGHWEGVEAAEAFSVFQAAQDNAELIGGFSKEIATLVARKLVAEIREGSVTLPRLPIRKREKNKTWLGWLHPVVEPQEAPPNWATSPGRSSGSADELEDRILAAATSALEEGADEPVPARQRGKLHPHWAEVCARLSEFPLLAEIFGQSAECVRAAQTLRKQLGNRAPSLLELDDLRLMFASSEDEPWERIGTHFTSIQLDHPKKEVLLELNRFEQGVAEVARVSDKVALQLIAFPVYVSFVLFPSTREYSAPKAVVSHELWRQLTRQRS